MVKTAAGSPNFEFIPEVIHLVGIDLKLHRGVSQQAGERAGGRRCRTHLFVFLWPSLLRAGFNFIREESTMTAALV